MREQGIEAQGLESLEGLLGPIEQGAGQAASAAVSAWLGNLAALIPRGSRSRARGGSGLELFAAWLAACGWPGEGAWR